MPSLVSVGKWSQEVLAYKHTRQDCLTLLEILTNHSLYTFEEELRRGYITVSGGHRVGLAGRTILDQGQVKQIRDVSSFNIRIAREVQGVGQEIFTVSRRSRHGKYSSHTYHFPAAAWEDHINSRSG